jgi:hypothetical protein
VVSVIGIFGCVQNKFRNNPYVTCSVLDFSADQNIVFFFLIKTNFIVEIDIVNKESIAEML